MISLTRHQADLLSYLKLYIAESGGVAPSYDEMAEAIGLAAKSGAHRLIVALEERGLIRRLPHRARAIEIVERNPLQTIPESELAAELERRGWHCLPLLRSGSSTARPGQNLPEPCEPLCGSGPSVSPIHTSETTCG